MNRLTGKTLSRMLPAGLIAFSVFTYQGCSGLKTVQINSLEIPSKLTSADQMGKSKVAVMPIAGRVNSKKDVDILRESLDKFTPGVNESHWIIDTLETEDLVLKDNDLLNAYKEVLEGVVSLDQSIMPDKDNEKFKVDPSPWDGQKGLRYEKMLFDPAKERVNWIISKTKPYNCNVSLAAAKRLAETLKCEYLLIPVVKDNYHYEKALHFAFFIPLMYTYNLNYSNSFAMYLIDSRSGQVVKAIVGEHVDSKDIGASLCRILEKDDVIGKISLNKIK